MCMTVQLGKEATVPGIQLIKRFEGFEAQAYPDPLHGWRVASIGYGTTVYAQGQRVAQGDRITLEQAELELRHFVVANIHPALAQISQIQLMNACMIGALESFAYNLGPHFYGGAHFQTITRKLRDGDWATLREALLLYVNPGSVVERGLRRRRQAEADLWEQGLAQYWNEHLS